MLKTLSLSEKKAVYYVLLESRSPLGPSRTTVKVIVGVGVLTGTAGLIYGAMRFVAPLPPKRLRSGKRPPRSTPRSSKSNPSPVPHRKDTPEKLCYSCTQMDQLVHGFICCSAGGISYRSFYPLSSPWMSLRKEIYPDQSGAKPRRRMLNESN